MCIPSLPRGVVSGFQGFRFQIKMSKISIPNGGGFQFLSCIICKNTLGNNPYLQINDYYRWRALDFFPYATDKVDRSCILPVHLRMYILTKLKKHPPLPPKTPKEPRYYDNGSVPPLTGGGAGGGPERM